MNKSKLLISVLLFLYILSFSALADEYEENSIIEEILILGVSRTQEEVISNQLPFAKGDYWQEEYKAWTIKRLTTLNIFAYEPLQVVTQPLDEGLRVIIRVADPSLLYQDPAEFLFKSVMELTARQLGLTLYNPLGTGHNFSSTLNWSDNYIYGAQVSKPFVSGRLRIYGRQYRSDRFNYQSEGLLAGFDHRYWWSKDLRTTAGLSLQMVEYNQQQQQLILPQIALYHQGLFYSDILLQLGLPLTDEQQFFGKINTVIYKPGDNLLNLIRLGYASEATPANHQFVVGGFSNFPLRAETEMSLATGYLLSTTEYHYSLNPSLKLIGFIDGGLVKKQELDTIINLGMGLAMDTPLGLPVRFDAAINPVSGNWRWNVGFGFTFSPPI